MVDLSVGIWTMKTHQSRAILGILQFSNITIAIRKPQVSIVRVGYLSGAQNLETVVVPGQYTCRVHAVPDLQSLQCPHL